MNSRVKILLEKTFKSVKQELLKEYKLSQKDTLIRIIHNLVSSGVDPGKINAITKLYGITTDNATTTDIELDTFYNELKDKLYDLAKQEGVEIKL